MYFACVKKLSHTSNIHNQRKYNSETLLISTEQKDTFYKLLQKLWRRPPEDSCRVLQMKPNSITSLINMH